MVVAGLQIARKMGVLTVIILNTGSQDPDFLCQTISALKPFSLCGTNASAVVRVVPANPRQRASTDCGDAARCIRFGPSSSDTFQSKLGAALQAAPNEAPVLVLDAAFGLCSTAAGFLQGIIAAPRVQWAHIGSGLSGIYVRRGARDIGRVVHEAPYSAVGDATGQSIWRHVYSYLLSKDLCAVSPQSEQFFRQDQAGDAHTAHTACSTRTPSSSGAGAFSIVDAELAARASTACLKACSREPDKLRCHKFSTCNAMSPQVGCSDDEEFCVHENGPACRLRDAPAFISMALVDCTACY